MDRVKKKFGFGCMRLPMIGDKVDIEQFKQMVDLFLESGFNYFDTAHVYLGGQSETAIREAVVKRYPRDAFILTDKLSKFNFNSEEEIRPLFETQLKDAGVDYFDFYLMHAQNEENFAKYKSCRAYETAFELKKEGKIRHVGISFHDSAEVLDKILTEYTDLEVVQIQFNYLDYEDDKVQSKACYDVISKHGKKAIVMEPVKGGKLANMADEAAAVFKEMGDASPASYAIRFAAGFENIFMVLSGMSTLAQMQDNVSYMKDFVPLSEEETAAVFRVRDIINSLKLIQCTACRYCTDGCPQDIQIPNIFAVMNEKKQFPGTDAAFGFGMATRGHGKPSDCVECGQCEDACPQKLPIRELLKQAAAELE
ncbi:MAG: aldo/keto reductase [Eubacteriaceae bacterium]|nr:aldo/keto reductase [Eubacteriaceae bacterium]